MNNDQILLDLMNKVHKMYAMTRYNLISFFINFCGDLAKKLIPLTGVIFIVSALLFEFVDGVLAFSVLAVLTLTLSLLYFWAKQYRIKSGAGFPKSISDIRWQGANPETDAATPIIFELHRPFVILVWLTGLFSVPALWLRWALDWEFSGGIGANEWAVLYGVITLLILLSCIPILMRRHLIQKGCDFPPLVGL